MKRMLIGEIAKLANITPRTVRYYEQMGLLGKVVQEENGFHYYDGHVLERLHKIAALKQLGLTLSEIQDVIELYFVNQLQGKQKTLQILEGHLADTESKISALGHFKSDLKRNIEKVKGFIRELE